MIQYMQHKDHGTHICYDHGEVERCKANGWVEIDNPGSNKKEENKEEKKEQQAVNDERSELIELLDAEGIPHDKRWGLEKLREAFEAAE